MAEVLEEMKDFMEKAKDQLEKLYDDSEKLFKEKNLDVRKEVKSYLTGTSADRKYKNCYREFEGNSKILLDEYKTMKNQDEEPFKYALKRSSICILDPRFAVECLTSIFNNLKLKTQMVIDDFKDIVLSYQNEHREALSCLAKA
jgi:hypothetical protein